MIEKISDIYAYIFAKKIFRKFNSLLHHLSLKGLGVLNYSNEYLIGENQWLKKYLSDLDEPVIFDVGANVGNYSQSVFEANATSRIFAFEPHPKNYSKLIQNIKNENFYGYNFAVGDEAGHMKLYDYDSRDGSAHASLYKAVISDLHKSSVVSHDVEVISLEKFFVESNIKKIDILKIDVEGNELSVLKGVENYIKNHQIYCVHFEFNEMNIISKTSFKDFWDLLSDYDIYRILPGGNLLHIRSYHPNFCEVYAFQNIVAILKDKKDAV